MENPIRVLLIEDNPGDANLVRRTLPMADGLGGFAVETATRLSAAISLLTSSLTVDVILLDLHLPDSTGVDSVNTLRQRFPKIPIVVLTNEDQPGIVLDAIKGGARDYFVKERLQRDALVECITRIVQRQRRRPA